MTTKIIHLDFTIYKRLNFDIFLLRFETEFMRQLEQQLKGKESVVKVATDMKSVLQFSFDTQYLDTLFAETLTNIVNDLSLYEYPLTVREALLNTLKDSREEVGSSETDIRPTVR